MGRSISHYKQKSPHRGPNPPHRNYPGFGLPSSVQSDNGPEFMSKVTQQLVQFLQMPWKFHIPYRPQSSRKVKSINRIIKETLTKLTLEIHLDWTKLLPIVLLRIQALPGKPLGLSPFEVMCGRPLLPPGLPPNLLPYQASYSPLCWQNSAMPSGNTSTTPCLPLAPKPPCPLYKLGTWSICLIIPRLT